MLPWREYLRGRGPGRWYGSSAGHMKLRKAMNGQRNATNRRPQASASVRLIWAKVEIVDCRVSGIISRIAVMTRRAAMPVLMKLTLKRLTVAMCCSG
jgi:hypothetical protein